MRYFTIHPSPTSDISDNESDEDTWCTTTDTSIHSDLGSFMEDMALIEGDLSDQYEHSDDIYDEETYDEFSSDTETEEEQEEEDEDETDDESKSIDESIEEDSEQNKTDETSYSTESDLTEASSDEEMMELDDEPVLKPDAQNTMYEFKERENVLKPVGLQFNKKKLKDIQDRPSVTNTAVEYCER